MQYYIYLNIQMTHKKQSFSCLLNNLCIALSITDIIVSVR